MLSAIFEQSVNVVQAFVCTAFVFLMQRFKKKVHYKAICYIICTALLLILFDICNNMTDFEGIAIFLYVLLLFGCSVVLFDDQNLKKLIISMIPLNALAIGSIVSTNIVSYFAEVQVYELMSENSPLRFQTVIISNVVSIGILMILILASGNSKIELDNHDWKIIGTILFISIITFYFIYNIAFEISSIIGKLHITLAVLGLTALNISAYVLLISLSRKNRLALENTLLKQQIHFGEINSQDIKRQYEQLHKMRHDFYNTLSVIQHLNMAGKSEQLDRYISEYLKKSYKDTIQTVTTDNDYINAIVSSKISEAKGEDIEVILSVIKHIDKINTMDICSLLGNMFDNAISACKKCHDRKKIILDISERNGSLEILMKNSVSSSVLKVNPTLATDKADKENHGYGTKIINEIAQRNHGIADFYEESCMFCCHVILSFEESNDNAIRSDR